MGRLDDIAAAIDPHAAHSFVHAQGEHGADDVDGFLWQWRVGQRLGRRCRAELEGNVLPSAVSQGGKQDEPASANYSQLAMPAWLPGWVSAAQSAHLYRNVNLLPFCLAEVLRGGAAQEEREARGVGAQTPYSQRRARLEVPVVLPKLGPTALSSMQQPMPTCSTQAWTGMEPGGRPMPMRSRGKSLVP